MEMIEAFSLVALIMAIGYTSIWLYFQQRQDRNYKEFKKRVNNEIREKDRQG
jgi:hypothetical protein